MARGGGKHYSGVRAVMTKKYAALDGKEFDTPEEAAQHSAKGAFKGLYRLTEADVENMLNGNDPAKASLVEKLASKLARNRKSDPSYVPRPRKAKAPDVAYAAE